MFDSVAIEIDRNKQPGNLECNLQTATAWTCCTSFEFACLTLAKLRHSLLVTLDPSIWNSPSHTRVLEWGDLLIRKLPIEDLPSEAFYKLLWSANLRRSPSNLNSARQCLLQFRSQKQTRTVACLCSLKFTIPRMASPDARSIPKRGDSGTAKVPKKKFGRRSMYYT